MLVVRYDRICFTIIFWLILTACARDEVAENTPTSPPAVAVIPAPTQPINTPVAATAVAEAAPPVTAESASTHQVFIPFTGNNQPTATPLPPPSATKPPPPTPTIDFTAVRQQLQAQGQDLAHVKIGFHTSIGGNQEGLDTWMQRLDAAGVPFFLMSADNAEPLFRAQQLMQASGVPHTLVYRRSGDNYDVPNYDLPPAEAARQHWQLHREAFPPELDPTLVWLETINEVDKNRSQWLAEFALATAELAIADGFRWAAFGWASGEPEPEHWQSPAMLAFLRFAAEHPDQIAIALHEYSFMTEDIADQYPYKVGRFQQLFQICDEYGIPRPTVLITEWGWAYQDVPSPGEALQHIAWASKLYAPYPQIKGAAIWHLGCCFANVANQTQRLIAPLTEYSLGNYYAIPLPPAQAPIAPELYRPSG
jgi:hypothetical protein